MSDSNNAPPLVATVSITLTDGTNRRVYTETVEASDGCPNCAAAMLGSAIGKAMLAIAGPGGATIAAEFVTDALDDIAGFFAGSPEDSGDDFDDGDDLDNDE